MPTVSATRMELLARKAQIALARQGRDLLEKKRTALMKEFIKVADTVIERSEALQHAAAEASRALAHAKALVGSEGVVSAALASRSDLPLEVKTASIMGVKVPHIEQKQISRPALGRGYSIVGVSLTIDEAATAFETEVESILSLAESELRLRRLVDEIQRTSRRLNALDHLLIPRLEAELEYIQMTLDERERADHFRMKMVKASLERRRRGQSPSP